MRWRAGRSGSTGSRLPVAADLAVVGPDPLYGGGGRALTDAFLAAARLLGREPELFYVPHPTLRPGMRRALAERAEVVRIGRGSRGLSSRLAGFDSLWVAATVATHGYAAALTGAPYACWIATTLDSENRGRERGLPLSRRLALRVNAPGLRAIEREVLAGARRVYAISDAARHDVATAAGIAIDRVGILPLPIDVDVFSPLPDEQWRRLLAHPTVVFVGRADDPRKNMPLLLAAWPLVRARHPQARLRLVGRPPRQPLPAGVEIVGEVPSVAEHLRDAAVFVLPSTQEGFGIAAAEALAAGVPVVSTPSGGPEAMLRDSGGGVVTSGWTPEELGETIASLLAEPERLLEMRRRGREYVMRQHTGEVLAAALREAFAEMNRDV
jgi:glycosyltransferase involved in cell wall biosynthesis